jgi:hypothetical protein
MFINSAFRPDRDPRVLNLRLIRQQPFLPLATGQPPGLPAIATLGGVTLGRDRATGQPVILPDRARTHGLYLVGKQGMGKSALLADLAVQDMQAGRGLCLLDPHRDLAEYLLGHVPPEREGDVILIDVRDIEQPPGLGLLRCEDPADLVAFTDALERAFQPFQRIWGPQGEEPSWGPQLEELLRAGLYTLLKNPPMTVLELPLLLRSAEFRARLVAALDHRPEDSEMRAFWRRFDGLRPQAQETFANSTRNKLARFAHQPAIRYLLGQSEPTIDFGRAMDEGKIILIQLDANKPTTTALLGSLIVGLITAAALGRPPDRRRPFNLYADEFPFFATPDFAQLIVQGRKFEIGTTLAHQGRWQFKGRSDPSHGATKGMGSYVLFQVQHDDAGELAGELTGAGLDQAADPLVFDPYAALERGRHPDPRVRAAFTDLRGTLLRIERSLGLQQEREANQRRDAHRYGGWATLPEPRGYAKSRLLELVRRHLYACMADGPDAAEAAAALAESRDVLRRRLPQVTWEDLLAQHLDALGGLLAAEPLREGDRGGRSTREALQTVLTQLGQFEAYAKLLVGGRPTERRIATPEYRAGGTPAEVAERVARIRALSREAYGRRRSDIDREIAERQGGRYQTARPARQPEQPQDQREADAQPGGGETPARGRRSRRTEPL